MKFCSGTTLLDIMRLSNLQHINMPGLAAICHSSLLNLHALRRLREHKENWLVFCLVD